MTKSSFGSKTLALLLFTLCLAIVAHGQTAKRAFVSAQHGNDANTASKCDVALPCRNFSAALTVVAPGGEIVALDSGGYGPTTITKSVTIEGPIGGYAAITSVTGNAITITAAATDVVVLRGLTLTGLSFGFDAINASSFGVLHIEGCVVSGFAGGYGLRAIAPATGSQVFVKDTIVRNGGTGLLIEALTGTIKASIDHCRLENLDTQGIFAAWNASVTVSNTIASGTDAGFIAGTNSQLNCDSCVASNNRVGFFGFGGTIRVKGSTVTNNDTGFVQSTGSFFSLGNNMVAGNTLDTDGTITLLAPR